MIMVNVIAMVMVNVMTMLMVIAYIQGDQLTSGSEVGNLSKADPAGVSIQCVLMVFPLQIKL